MKRLVPLLFMIYWAMPLAAAVQQPAKGMFLVATDGVRGEVFAQTVILLLHYDENGAMGIVVNRPTDVELAEVVDDIGLVSSYSGTLFWGGPVQMNSLRALLRTDSPPPGAEMVINSVYHVDIDDELTAAPSDPATLRFYIGYAGWAAGQLESELARGSWHVVPATDKHVFDEDPRTLWERLTRRTHLVAEGRASRPGT